MQTNLDRVRSILVGIIIGFYFILAGLQCSAIYTTILPMAFNNAIFARPAGTNGEADIEDFTLIYGAARLNWQKTY